MDSQHVQITPTKDPQEEQAEWVTPEIVEYDIEEVTRSAIVAAANDGFVGYS